MADTRFSLPGASLRKLHQPGTPTPESLTADALAFGNPRSAEYRAHLEQLGGSHD